MVMYGSAKSIMVVRFHLYSLFIVKRINKFVRNWVFIIMFILFSYLVGFIPFSFTVTSHIFQTFFMGFSLIVALTIIGFLKHKIYFLKLFLPSGAPVFLAPLLISIEIISYVSRAFSLSIRLFA